MIWPPVRFAYSTTILNPPTPLPTPPTWMLTDGAMPRPHLTSSCKEPVDSARAGSSNLCGSGPIPDGPGHRRPPPTALVSRCCSASFSPESRRSSGSSPARFRFTFGGWLDLAMQRIIEIWSSLPHLYILIILSAILPPSFFVLLTILLLFSWVSLVHLVRAEFLRARNFEYVNAARALGSSNAKIIVKHVLPNAMVATLTFLPFIVNSSISTLTSLDLLGLGMPPGIAVARRVVAPGQIQSLRAVDRTFPPSR